MPNSRSKYTQEFKQDAVRQVLAGSSVSETASAMAIPVKTLATWVKQNQQNQNLTTDNAPHDPDKNEVARLRRELASMKLEMSRLMQATAQFIRFSI
jgi:transposase